MKQPNPNWEADVRADKPLAFHKSTDANVAYTEKPLP